MRTAEPVCSPVSYQWQHVGTNLPPETHPGSTNRTYSFDAVAEAAGDYRVIVSNPWASVTSAVARVAFDARPVLSTQPTVYQRVREGDAFTNQVAVACPSLSLNYVWQLRRSSGTNYTDVVLDSRHVLTTNGWLIIRNAQTNETGYYRVLVSNIYSNTGSSDGLVRVVKPPPNDYFTNAISLGSSNPASATGYNEFATYELGEKPHALQGPSHSVWWVWTNPYPSIVTVDLGGSDIDTVLSVYTGTTLSNLNSVAEDDDGRADKRSLVNFMAGGGQALYLAVDGKNQAEGTNLVVSVTAAPIPPLAPVITNQPLNLAASPGDKAVFSLLAYGSPDITIQWYGKGAPVPGTTQIVGLTNYLSTLTLNNVTTNDQGVYRAVLSNSYGSVTSAIAVLTFGSIVRGMVSDATKAGTNGLAVGIPGVLVSVGNVSDVTDTNGNYELVGVQLGDLRADFMANNTHVHLKENVQFWNLSTASAAQLTATKAGYYDYVDDHFEVGRGQSIAKWFSMSPIFFGVRFVMNWTNKPGDLDILLHFPTNVPVSYPFIDYLPQNQGSTSGPPFAIRDVDMRNGWGPETISILRLYPGTYNVYARKYPGESGYYLSQSSAQVVAYMGGDVTNVFSSQLKAAGSITVPTVGTNDWWHVCDIDGVTTNITWVNQLMATPPGGLAQGPLVSQIITVDGPKGYPQPKDRFATNVDYEWTFGDGSSVSNQPEPLHAYADPGWKTVSLKMTQRTGSPLKIVSLTKTNYIFVENIPPIVAITNPMPGTIFRAGDPITLQSSADGVDDAVQEVAYYQVVSGQTNYLGTATNAPYSLVLPNTTFMDATNVFVALARDVHGATGWSEPVPLRIVDLRGDILIIRNFASSEINEMVGDLGDLIIPYQDPSGHPSTRQAIVKVLDQEGLYFGLVQDFKAIIWNDQGTTDGGLTDNDVGVLQQASDANIPLYLIGERLAQSRDFLTDMSRYQQWTDLLGSQRLGLIPPPMHVHGIPIPEYKDGLYYGWEDQAATNILIGDALERLSLIATNMDVVADVPVSGTPTNSPIMLRYPRYSQPDFGETRRLVQGFRVTSDQPPQSLDETDSREDRRIIFVNGVAWLLRLFECQAINVTLECQDPGSGVVGQPMTFSIVIGQNGACTSGGVLVTNYLSPRLQALSATLTPLQTGAPTNNYQLIVTSNLTVVRFSGIPRVSYLLETLAVPQLGGWITNVYTVVRGITPGASCSQVSFIQGPGCEAVQLNASFATNQLLHLAVRGGVGCAFILQSSTDLLTWVDSVQIQPDADPYDVPIAPRSDTVRFYRLRKVQ
jgi:PKD repeat protein